MTGNKTTTSPSRGGGKTDDYLYFALGVCVALVLILLVVFLVVVARRRKPDLTKLLLMLNLNILGRTQQERSIASIRRANMLMGEVPSLAPTQADLRLEEVDSGWESVTDSALHLPFRHNLPGHLLFPQGSRGQRDYLPDGGMGHRRAASFTVPMVHVSKDVIDFDEVEPYGPVGFGNHIENIKEKHLERPVPLIPKENSPGNLRDKLYASAENFSSPRPHEIYAQPAKDKPASGLSRSHSTSRSCEELRLYEDINNLSARKERSVTAIKGQDEKRSQCSWEDADNALYIAMNNMDVQIKSSVQKDVTQEEAMTEKNPTKELYARPDKTKKKTKIFKDI